MILAVVLVLIGLGFVLAEVFFVSLGLLGLVAAGFILSADVIAFGESETIGWIFVVAEVILIPVVVRLAFRALPHLPFGRRMLLSGPVTQPRGSVPDLAHLVGRHGRALTSLRPVGTVDFDGERVSAVALGGLVERGADVVVEAVEGSEVRVRIVSPPPDGSA